MTRRLPLLPTLLVALACAVMIGLGVWQLQRADEKAALKAQYRLAATLPEMAFPVVPDPAALPLFRRAAGLCVTPSGWRTKAGRNRSGENGWVHIVQCGSGVEGPGMAVELGWSRQLAQPVWTGGPVSGVITSDSESLIRLVSDRALAAGLEPSAPPDMNDVPDNHLSYAIQWFAFAALALGIFAIALRRRHRASPQQPDPVHNRA